VNVFPRKTVSKVNEVKGYRTFGGCLSMPSGRVSNVKYAGNCKTNALEPEIYNRLKYREKLPLKDETDSLFFVCHFLIGTAAN